MNFDVKNHCHETTIIRLSDAYFQGYSILVLDEKLQYDLDMSFWLITGGAGYIGSYVAKLLVSAGIPVVIFDQSVNVSYLQELDVTLVEGSLSEESKLTEALQGASGVIHLAGYKYARESINEPIKTYQNNVAGTISLMKAMKHSGVDKIVFSSSCSVYGSPKELPVIEISSLQPLSPYAMSKVMAEQIISETIKYEFAGDSSSYVFLRYFNVAGCSVDGPKDDSTRNLFPQIVKSVLSKEELPIYGKNFPTPDGTCIRDYIHVKDVAWAHLLIVKEMERQRIREVFNLSTGQGTSTLQIVQTFEEKLGVGIPIRWLSRNSGDPAAIYGVSAKFEKRFNWKPEIPLDTIVADVIREQIYKINQEIRN